MKQFQLPVSTQEEVQALGVLLGLAIQQIGHQAANGGLAEAAAVHAFSGNVLVWKQKIEASEEIPEAVPLDLVPDKKKANGKGKRVSKKMK